MKKEYEEKCYITFPTTRGTANVLTELAHIFGMTQPELLDKICREYIEKTVSKALQIHQENQGNE